MPVNETPVDETPARKTVRFRLEKDCLVVDDTGTIEGQVTEESAQVRWVTVMLNNKPTTVALPLPPPADDDDEG